MFTKRKLFRDWSKIEFSKSFIEYFFYILQLSKIIFL